jgi:hypothetical protein
MSRTGSAPATPGSFKAIFGLASFRTYSGFLEDCPRERRRPNRIDIGIAEAHPLRMSRIHRNTVATPSQRLFSSKLARLAVSFGLALSSCAEPNGAPDVIEHAVPLTAVVPAQAGSNFETGSVWGVYGGFEPLPGMKSFSDLEPLRARVTAVRASSVGIWVEARGPEGTTLRKQTQTFTLKEGESRMVEVRPQDLRVQSYGLVTDVKLYAEFHNPDEGTKITTLGESAHVAFGRDFATGIATTWTSGQERRFDLGVIAAQLYDEGEAVAQGARADSLTSATSRQVFANRGESGTRRLGLRL